MVAALAASPAHDVSTTSELGSLLLGYRSIREPRWRLRAVVALAPVCRQFGISLEPLRDELRRGVRASVCPAAARACLEQALVDKLEHGCVRGLALIIDALFTREWRRCSLTAIAALLALDDVGAAFWLGPSVSERRYVGELAASLVKSGCTTEGEFVGNVQRCGSEVWFRPSLPLLQACVDAVVAHGQRERVDDIEKLARSLRPHERARGEAHLARLTLCFETPGAALARVRAIHERSIRAGGLLLLTRAAQQLDTMRMFASAIETKLLRQVATLEIARALDRRGLHRHALRALQPVEDPRLAAERILLGAEVQLTTCRRSEEGTFVSGAAERAAYSSPAWTQLARPFAIAARADLVHTAMLLRFALRKHEGIVLEHASQIVHRHAHTADWRRCWLDLVERSGVDVEAGLLSLQTASNASALDALRAEHIAMRAEVVVRAALPPALSLGLAAQSIDSADARTIERAHFDEGFALSSASSTRRRVLIATAQTCLRGALAQPEQWPREVVTTRLRTLVHLGGDLARDAIRKALSTLPMHPSLTPLAVRALCQLDAPAASRFVLERAAELFAAGIDLQLVLEVLELFAGVPRGVSRAYSRAWLTLTRNGHDARAWLADLLALLRARADSLVRVLDGVASRSVIPPTPHALLAELDDVPQQLIGLEHVALAQKLVDDTTTLEVLLVARPASVDPKMEVWSTTRWADRLRAATKYAGVYLDQISRFVRKFGRRHWYEPLRRGDLTELGVIAVTPFTVAGGEYRLRVLDKRLDILTYLRFADLPVRSCFRSDNDYALPKDTIEAWKDPLTLCCHIERRVGDSFQPCGFWFGSFASADEELALVMNSLHVRPNAPELRKQIVRSFEKSVCEPLRIVQLGVANQHGGHGELPESYVTKRVRLIRYRALGRDGWPLVWSYDDISDVLNDPVSVDHLYWRSVRSE